jgi:pimeloyl-ACP methyl ester carboxylesterase
MSDDLAVGGGERVPLLLLPGLLCDRALWECQVRHLGDVAESQVADLSGADSVAALAASVLAAAPPRFALAGLSMGGYVAFEIMRQAPERVIKLALLDTSARPDAPETLSRRRGLIELARSGRFRGVTPRLLPLLIHPDRQFETELTGSVMAMAARVGQEAFVRQQTAIMGRPDSRPGLEVIACPTLVLGGREDALTPPSVLAEIADAIPGARYVIIEDCGHLPPLERPHAVSALLRQWLIYG